MLIKSEFKMDLIQVKHTSDKDGLLNVYKLQAARELGAEVVKLFPYTKNDERSFKGNVPEVSMNRDHEFTDHYESRLWIMTEEDYDKLFNLVKSMESGVIRDTIVKLLSK